MRSWPSPNVPTLPGRGELPVLVDTASGERRRVLTTNGTAGLYVCGITPYDATHLGHAATYLAYDTLVRVLRDAGAEVEYVQNVTDVDDPLLERANATDVDWRELAEEQTELFRGDMTALGVLPPTHYVGVVESIERIADAVAELRAKGFAYEVTSPDAASDWYFDIRAAERETPWRLGVPSRLDYETMLELSAERGGDPDRPGKRDRLDPLLWRAERPGEPAWESPLGRGRPGWHIECSVIGLGHLTVPVSVNGGGSDLVFPHHELSASHSSALTGEDWARIYTHTGMVALDGVKMSKSLGNLEFVSRLTREGVDPEVIRLALLDRHYRDDWEWFASRLDDARARLERWREWARSAEGESGELVARLRTALADDLDTPRALAEVDAALEHPATRTDLDAIQALLGIALGA